MDITKSWLQSQSQSQSVQEGNSSDTLRKFRALIEADETVKCEMNDEFLMAFIRARKYNLERALQLLKKYLVAKEKVGPISSIAKVLDEHYGIVLKKPDQHDRPIFLFRTGRWDTKRYSFDDIFTSTFLLLIHFIMSCPEVQLNGITVVSDLTGFGFNHAAECSLGQSRQVVQLLQESFPLRIKAVHVINEPRLFGMVFSIAKQFMSTKMRQRYFFHGSDLTSLHQHINTECLPLTMGGCTEDEDAFRKELTRDLLLDNESDLLRLTFSPL